MVSQSMSVSHDAPAGHAHNIEEEYRAQLNNIDSSRTRFNVVIKDTPLSDLYEAEFSSAMARYNLKQAENGHPERQITDYLAKITNSKQEKPAYEMVVQIGNRDTNPATDSECRTVSADIYEDFVAEFKAKFPNFKIFQAVIHMDEATPHLHIAYVPVSTGNKRGLETKNSLRGAVKEMGYNDIRDVNKALFKLLEDVSHNYGIKRLELGVKRAHLSVRDFKTMAAEIEKEEYPYRNDPRLMELITQQQTAIEQLSGILDEQEANISTFTDEVEQAGIFNHKRLKEAAREARSASQTLHQKRNPVSFFAQKAQECIKQVPQFWRDYISNPVADRLRKEALRFPSHSLSQRSAQSKDLLNSLRSGRVQDREKQDDFSR